MSWLGAHSIAASSDVAQASSPASAGSVPLPLPRAPLFGPLPRIASLLALGASLVSSSAADRTPTGPADRGTPPRADASTNSTTFSRVKGDQKSAASVELPDSPREWLNAGTRHLNQGKLREAEVCLENALLAQADNIRPVALYNAGHVRFGQGLEEIKKGPTPSTALTRGAGADRHGGEAVQAADEALQSNVVGRMVQAYLRGRGTRRELKQASEVVRQALQAHSAALLKWQRSSGDFHSAAELVPSDRDAQHNADVVDRHIARLIDTIRQLQEAAAALAKQTEELREKMKQLRGKIPQQDMPPGASGEEDEEDEENGKKMPEQGQQEAPTQTGMEIELTPEQAQWLLEGFRLDRERRLPMGQEQQSTPKDRNRPDW